MCIDEEYRSANSPDAIFGQSRNRDGWMATEKCMHRTVGLNSDCHNRFDLCESALRARLADSQDRIACEGGSLDRNFKPRGGTLLLLSGSFQDDPYRMMKHRALRPKGTELQVLRRDPFRCQRLDESEIPRANALTVPESAAALGSCLRHAKYLLVPNANEPLQFTRTQHFVFGARFPGRDSRQPMQSSSKPSPPNDA